MGTAPEPSKTELPAQEGALHDFRLQIKQLTLSARCGREYVQVAKLRKWLCSIDPQTNESQVQRVVYACMESRRPSLPKSQLDSHETTILLGTLCLSGYTQYLERLWQSSEFRNLPLSIQLLQDKFAAANIPHAKTAAYDFFNIQWRFCPVVFDLHDTKTYQPHCILPINYKERINDKSGNAELMQVEILEEFIAEDLQKQVPKSRYECEDGFGARYNFALKTFRGEHLEPIFDRERQNFITLRGVDRMVNCLNTFVHHEFDTTSPVAQERVRNSEAPQAVTYNFLLEYGDRDLDTYFVQLAQPFFGAEIARFWEALFEVVKAVAAIHEFVNPDTKKHQAKGVHGDIKPDNILVVEGKFKLADFGYTKFDESEKTSSLKIYLSGGTWKFGAPEYLPHSKNSENPEVGRSVDIWSLGCVFSIAATWVVGGYAHVRDYTRVRTQAVKRAKVEPGSKLQHLDSADLFCDGNRVLEDVTQWHELLRASVRRSDPITTHVLDLIDKKMLLKDPSNRINCEDLCTKLAQIIAENPVDPTMEPPKSIQEALKATNDEAPQIPSPASASVSKQRETNSTGTAQDRIQNKAQILNAPTKKTAYRDEYLRSALKNRTRTVSGESTSSFVRRRSRSEQDFSRPITVNTVPKQPVQNEPSVHPHDSRPITVNTTAHQPLQNESSPSHRDSTDRSKAPHESVDIFQVNQQIEKKATHFLGWVNNKLKSHSMEHLDSYCKRFDFKFLIDNGCSMEKQWPFAAFALRVLAALATNWDANGVDLTYTCHGQDINDEKRPDVLANSMRNKSNKPMPEIHTDMHNALSRVFQNYSDTFLRHSTTHKKQFLLIVLTDGIWTKQNNMQKIRDSIVKFLRNVTTKLSLNKPFCIQFVQFGQDADATNHLQYLDERLCKVSGLDDSIDTEHILGDVKKMFLGSHDDAYDNLAPVFSPVSPPTKSPPLL